MKDSWRGNNAGPTNQSFAQKKLRKAGIDDESYDTYTDNLAADLKKTQKEANEW